MARTTSWLMCAAAGSAVTCSPRRTSEAGLVVADLDLSLATGQLASRCRTAAM